MTQDPMREVEALKKRLFVYQNIVLLLVLSTLTTFFLFPLLNKKKRTATDVDLLMEKLPAVTSLPFYKEVSNIISPLAYSGMKILLRPNAKLKIDFKQNAWRIVNYHQYDENNKIKLEEGRYGLCGQLASYIRDDISKIFGRNYTIRLVQASQAGYFLLPQSSHYVLSAQSKVDGKQYIIDPSFHRYGSVETFDDYFFFNSYDSIEPIEKGETDAVFRVSVATPLLIVNDYMIDLQVDRYENHFDKDNFVIAVSATKQYKYSGRRIFVLMMRNGQPAKFENKELGRRFFSPVEYDQLTNLVFSWFKEVIESSRSVPV